jgi:hypothetical protein
MTRSDVAGSLIGRFNPFQPDRLALGEPPFDPRKQSWVAGALSAIEAFAGAVLALPFVASVAFSIVWLTRSEQDRLSSAHHQANVWIFYGIAECTLLSAALLWAGLALMFGRPSRYRAHGVLALVLLALLGVRTLINHFSA